MKNSSQHMSVSVYGMLPASLRRRLWLLLLSMVLLGFMEMAVAGCVSLLGVAMSSPESLGRIPYLSDIEALLCLPPDIPPQLRMLALVLGLVVAASAFKNACLAWLNWRLGLFGQDVSWWFGARLFRKFMGAPYVWHASQNTAELLTCLSWRDILAQYCNGLLTFATQAFILLFLLGGSLCLAPLMTLLLFGFTAVMAVAMHRACRNKAYAVANEIRTYDLYNSRVGMQSLQGLAEVTIYEKKNAMAEAYIRYAPRYRILAALRLLLPMIPPWALSVTGIFLLFLVLLFMVVRGDSVAWVTGTLTLLAAVSWRLLPAVNLALSSLVNLRGLTPMLEKLFDFDAALTEAVSADRPLRRFKREIRLEHIAFTYPKAEKPAVDDISISIPKGGMIGFVGVSGSGKSTLCGIITGLLQAGAGGLLVDGAPLNPREERLHIGYVPQSLYLLDATLAENVAYSRWGEPIDRERVLRCCRMAAIDFLDELPEGVDSMLGERGKRLSGGQVQRVGIARAIYDNPDLLVFDEATSALDGAAEKSIQSTILSLRSQITMLVIAHRLTTVADCDVVYWIDKGRVVKSGPPPEVLPEYEAMLRRAGAGG